MVRDIRQGSIFRSKTAVVVVTNIYIKHINSEHPPFISISWTTVARDQTLHGTTNLEEFIKRLEDMTTNQIN